MRLGVDLFALQAASCRGRGIGRYGLSLVRTLRDEAPDWEFVFYRRSDLPLDWSAGLDRPADLWVELDPDPSGEPDGRLQTLVQRDPDRLDWLLTLNPLVERRGYALPEPVPHGPKLAAVVYDFIPALFPRHYLGWPGVAAEYHNDLRRLGSYDLLLAISESTRRDSIRLLGVAPRRVVNISAASDPEFFRPADADEEPGDEARVAATGVRGPFFYYLGNADYRKNALGLVDAYAALTAEVREAHQLALTCQRNDWFDDRLRERVDGHGLAGRVVSTGPVDDLTVRALCRRAELFLFPSLSEGFGLPLLEAMQCGAVVVAADNSAQPEVVGDAGVLAPTGDPAAWADRITALVVDPARIGSLRRAAVDRAARFTWPSTARRLVDALRRAEASATPRRPVVAAALVLYPTADPEGFSGASTALVADLCRRLRPLVFADTADSATLPAGVPGSGWHNPALLRRVLDVHGNPPVLHVLEKPGRLGPLIEALAKAPGLVLFLGQDGSACLENDDLIKVLGLTPALICNSDRLAETLGLLAARNGGGPPIHRLAGDAGAALEALLSSVRPSTSLRESSR